MQKFHRGDRVKIKHLDCEAIVEYSYNEKYSQWGKEEKFISYSLWWLTDQPHSSSWFNEEDLILLSNDRVQGKKLLPANC